MPRPTKVRAHLARLSMLKRRLEFPVPAVHQQAVVTTEATGSSLASIEPCQGNEVGDSSIDSVQSADNTSELSSKHPFLHC
jgi:hypothetical protein